MKKSMAKVLCLVLALSAAGCGRATGDLNPDKWNADADSYERVEIINGDNGEIITITDADSIEKLVEILNKGYEREQKHHSDGFRYGVNFCGKSDDNQKITILSENTIVYSDGYDYRLCLGGGIDLDYIDSLFEEADAFR